MRLLAIAGLRGTGTQEIARMRFRFGDGRSNTLRLDAAPEHVPCRTARHAVGYPEVPGQHRIVVAGAPEEALEITAESLPEVVADTFALGLRLDGELAQVGARAPRQEHRRTAVLLVEVDGEQRALEELGSERASEARFDQRSKPRHVDRRVRIMASDGRAALHERAGALHRE